MSLFDRIRERISPALPQPKTRKRLTEPVRTKDGVVIPQEVPEDDDDDLERVIR